MSATPKPADGAWSTPQFPTSAATPFPTPEGQDALQVLLAFACIHEQAIQRRYRTGLGVPPESPYDEYFGLDEVLRLVAARALAITGADGVAIALAKENAIVCRASMGRIAPDPGIRLDPDSGFSGACLRNGQTVRCNDSETDPLVNAQACRALGTRSMVAVPLMAKARVIGLIEAFSSETYGFNESDVSSLQLLGELILAAIHPEEEDRLAQLADKILPQPPALQAVPGPEPEAPQQSAVPQLALEEMPPPVSVGRPEEEDGELVPPFKLEEHGDALKDLLNLQKQAKGSEGNSAEPLIDVLVPTKEVVVESVAAPTILPQSEVRPEPLASAKFATEPIPIPTPKLVFPDERRSRSRWLLVAALLLVAGGLGWSWLRHAEQLTSANTSHSTPFSSPAANSATDATDVQAPTHPALKPGVTPQVTGIRHWSSAESSTVVVDMEDQVQYEAHTLDDPPRIYFDLFDTKLAPGLLNQSIVVDDTFIKRVRMAEPKDGTTRVVLDTKGLTEVSVKLDGNPYRLTIDVHKAPSSSPPTLSKPSPAISSAPAPATTKIPRSASTSAEFRLVLDAGHGGWDLGTVGRKGLLEKDLVLDVVQRLGKLVQERLGADVVYTRTDDSYLPLEKRAEIANLAKADLFLSVHANYSDLVTARGVETYYTTTYSSMKARTAEDDPALKDVNWTGIDIREKVTNSHRLATDVQDSLYGALATRNPGIRNRGVKEAQYVVLTGTQMPAVLAEVSFVSSPADEDQLENSAYRQQIAEALFRGVAKYRAEVRHTKLASRLKPTSNSE